VTLRPRVLLWTGIASFAAGFAALSSLRHLSFDTGRFDLGNMVQAVWSTAHGHPLRVTNLRGEQVSRLAAHFDPILAALAPLWWVWPSPHMLLAVQAILTALGALPVFWLARKHLDSDYAGVGFALAYLVYPATQWLTLNEFHPVALACPFLLFAFWYLDEDRLVAFALFAGLAMLTKEEIPLVVAGMGIWYALGRRRPLAGGAIAIAGLVVAVVAVHVVVPHFHGSGSHFYGRYNAVGGSAAGIVRTAFTDPGKLLSTAFDHRGAHYLLHLVLPLAGLSLLAPLVLIAAVPELALNLLSSAETQSSIHYHYTAAEIAILVPAAILGAKRLGSSARFAPVVAVAAAVVGNYVLGPLPAWRWVPGGQTLKTTAQHVSEHDRIAERALRVIPRDASVAATNSLGAHLSERRRILSFPVTDDAQWLAVDEKRPSLGDHNASENGRRRIEQTVGRPEWHVVFDEDGVVVLRRARAGRAGSGGTPTTRP
jgi:uncharacterized membrane protein